jgi:hypothetical protein
MNVRRQSMVWAGLVALALAIQPPSVTAQAAGDDAGIDRFGSAKFWDYALCGASIVLASGTGGWIMAGLVCGKAITEHWTR